MLAKKKFPKILKYIIRGLPLAGVVVSASLPLNQFSRQFMVLMVLLWMQAFFLLEIFLAGR